jgi:hypothetical protein
VKPARWIAFLATCNVLLLTAVLWQARLLRNSGGVRPEAHTVERRDAAPGSAANPEIGSVGFESALRRQGAMASSTTRPLLDWREVEAPDYPTYIGNLRAIGVPEQTVRDIVTADVVQGFALRRAEVLADRDRELNFWETRPDDPAARAELMRQRREVDEAMGDTLRELLGPDIIPPSTENEWRRAELELQLAFLPPDKRDSTRAVLSRYADIDAQIKELADGRRSTEELHELERIVTLYETKRAELARLISPDEYEQVELTVSWTAENLRRAMARFGPTEEEFRAIFKVWRAHDENLAQLSATLQPDPGNAHVFESIREFLGEERYAEYRRTWWQ